MQTGMGIESTMDRPVHVPFMILNKALRAIV
ncbi:ISHde2, transposase orfB [Candidatus Hamiltonella defensa 5AT (Acyrthosiphon pisum)]|uniref:ISHde2, transposase orfB n=1 Tax=Hamiltonella defensa subsp. Acyrthosiphon pisum (strain 5AT) TaxID=572265 RepID=C4K5X1_HAMD5|nr:ISHde2, transposase orfB [Candidatus Hamiltonella defensa 5AT (Acyrthosiphon pisum)]